MAAFSNLKVPKVCNFKGEKNHFPLDVIFLENY